VTGPALTGSPFPLILAAPSGAGKTTIAREMASRRSDMEFSISATTRPPRPGERDGVDYHFRKEDEFRRMIGRGELLEWAEVHGCHYGTPVSNLEGARKRGHYLLLDIDVQGSRQIKHAVPHAVSIFLLPPSSEELARRLIGRGSEDLERRTGRLHAARNEIETAAEFDYVIVNEEVDASVKAVEAILIAEGLRSTRLGDTLARQVEWLIQGVDEVLSP